jgi:hypothetical protein
MDFVEILKLLYIFDVTMKKFYQLQNILKNFTFYTICVNHNEKYYCG